MDKKIKILTIGLIFTATLLSSTSTQAARQPRYINEELGIRIVAPKGWHMTKPKTKKTYYLFLFHKYPIGSTAVGANPGIVASAKPVYKEKTALAAARRAIRDIIKPFHKNVAIIEGPKKVKLNKNKGVKFVSEMTVPRKKRTFRIKQIDYIFLRGGMEFRLTAFCEPEEFENNLQAFQESLNTLVIR